MNNPLMPVVTLPTLTPQALEQYILNTASKDEKAKEIAAELYMLLNDDAPVIETKLFKATNQANSLIKKKHITSTELDDEGKKRTADKNTLEVLLSQEVFGRTGSTIRLPHSGFTVRMKPIQATERIELERLIANSVIQLHRSLSGQILSGIYVHIYKEIFNFFISKIESTTAAVERINDLRKIIRTKDLPIILISILDMIYPDGYDFNYICGEIVLENDVNEICGNTSEVYRIDIKDLVYITDDLKPTELEQLYIDKPYSISLNAIKAYQAGMKYNEPAKVNIGNLTITLESSVVDRFINRSEEWLKNNVINHESFERDDVELLTKLINTSKVGMYYYMIESIETPTHITDTKGNTITVNVVNILSTNTDIADLFTIAAKASVLYTYHTIGVPKYTCPSCLANKNPEDNSELTEAEKIQKHNNEIITNVNLIDLFSILV